MSTARHLLSVDALTDAEVERITRPGYSPRVGRASRRGTLACLFQQPSLRTMSSFAFAGARLGLTPVPIATTGDALRDQCDLHDEVRQLSLVSTCVAVRSAVPLDAARLVRLGAPVVNAGDGSNEHPTQALVDIAAMRRDGLDGRTVVLMGNLRDHRVHHSLARLLGRQDVRLVLVSPAGLELPPRFLPEGAQQIEATDARTVDEVLATADFVYMTPVQYWNTPDARHGDVLSMDLARARRVLRREAKVLHPFPRLGELAEDLDGSPWDGYHAQTALGPEVRRRTLALLLDA
jgi:aspartate carbamoyltransferase catalytic subunit